MPYAAFPEAMGGLPAAEIWGGHCLDRYHSKRGPHSISFTWSLLDTGSQVPLQTCEVGCGIDALTHLPCDSDVPYDFRRTALENLLWNSISQTLFPRKLVFWGPVASASGCSLAGSSEFGES